MRALARFVAHWWWAVIVGWLLVAGALFLAAPPFAEVATFDEAAFLPEDSSAIQGGQLLERGWPDDNFSRTAAVLLVRDGRELQEQDVAFARELVTYFREQAPDVFGDVTTHLDDEALADAFVSDDGQALFFLVGLEVPPFTPPATEGVEQAREHLDGLDGPSGLEVHLTGSAAVAADESAAIEASVNRTHVLTLVLVATILLLVYRSPIAPIVPLVTILVAFVTSISLVSLLAQWGMDVTSLFETFSIVIVFGAGTDYCLFLISRYHEELHFNEQVGFEKGPRLRTGTLAATVIVLGSVLASSAGTTIAGFTSMTVAEFGMFRTMGPAMAIAVAITLLVALTLAPALIRLFGPIMFWPNLPVQVHFDPDEPLVASYDHRALGLDQPLARDEARP